MTGSTCPRCHGPLPEAVVRAMAMGTTCPFCAEPLKKGAAQSLDAPPADDEGYATFEVGASPAARPAGAVGLRPTAAAKPAAVGQRPAAAPASKPALAPSRPAPAPSKPAPAPVNAVAATAAALKPAAVPAPGMTTAAAPKTLKQTMIGGAFAPRDNPFDGTPAPAPFSLSPPSSAPVTRSPAAAAAARVAPVPSAATPAPARAPAQPVRSSAPAARSPTAAAAPRSAAAVMSILDASDSEPTHAVPPTAVAAAPTAALAMSESEPTLSAPPAPIPAAAIPPRDEVDSAPIASVTVMPDSAPVAYAPVGLQLTPRRRLPILAVGMGLAIVLVSFLLFKVVRGRKVPVPPAATEVAKAAPEPAVEPIALVEPTPAPPPPAPAKAKAPAPAREAPAPRVKAVPVAQTSPAPVVEKRRHSSHRTKKGRHERAPRARKVALAKPAKASAPAAPVEHADPRPAYERGNASLLAGDGKAAIAAYREAVKSSPSDPIGFRGLGLAYEHEGETALAIKALRRYLKLAPEADDRAIISRRLDRLAHRAKKK